MIDKFLAEAALEKPQTLDRAQPVVLGLAGGVLPEQAPLRPGEQPEPGAAYNGDSKPIRFLDADTIANAFLHCEERKVDKSGCISFESKKYEVGLTFIGCKVDVVYDPADTEELTIEYEGHTPWKARQLVIGEKTGERPHLPERMLPEPADSSRLLAAAAKKNKERKEQHAPAISYRAIRKGEGGGNV